MTLVKLRGLCIRCTHAVVCEDWHKIQTVLGEDMELSWIKAIGVTECSQHEGTREEEVRA